MFSKLVALGFLVFPCVVHGHDIDAIRYLEVDGIVEVSSSGNATIQTPFTLASVGKTMTSVAILRLVSDGVLSLDKSPRNWLPPETVSGLGGLDGITLRHLLNMTSGLPDYLTDDYIEDALADPNGIQNPQTALSYAYGERPMFAPGYDFDYSNTNYVLLGMVLENATGLNYADVMQRHVFAPAKMKSSFVFGSTNLPENFPNGHEDGQHIRDYYEAQGFGDGGVISTAPDISKFYHALFVAKGLLTPLMMKEFKRDIHGVGYGMGIEIEDGTYGHSGGDLGFSTDVRLEIKTGAIAIILIAEADADTAWTFEALQKQ